MIDSSLELLDYQEITIKPLPPFSFTGTFCKPSHFPTPDINYGEKHYWQTLLFKDEIYGLKIINSGTIYDPQLSVKVYFDSSKNTNPDFSSIIDELSFRYDLFSDLSEFNEIFSDADQILSPVIDRWIGMRISTPYSLYEFTVVTTVLQNTTVHRTVQMMNNLFNNYGKKIIFDGKELFTFWSNEKITTVSEEELRSIKLGYRAKTLHRQANEFQEINENNLRKIVDSNILMTKLLEIYGIGPATVQYILSEVFHKYDLLTHISPWEQKIYSQLIHNEKLTEKNKLINEIDKRWGEWKMLAIHYIFEDLFWKRKEEKIEWLEDLINY